MLLAVAATPGVLRLRYDHNLLNLQPKHIDSVRWEHVLLTESDRSVWFAVSMADSPAELLSLKARFESLPSVERTEEIVTLQPASSPASQTLIRGLHERLTRLPTRVPLLPAMTAADLQGDLSRAGPELAAGLASRPGIGPGLGGDPVAADASDAGREFAATECLATAGGRVGLGRLRLLARVHGTSTRRRPRTSTPPLSSGFVGRNGRHLLRVYARGSIWDMDGWNGSCGMSSESIRA